MATRAKLLEVRAVLAAAARAAEPWEESYKRDPKTFREMLRAEQRLRNDVGEYFYSLATERLSRLINWAEVTPALRAAAVVPGSDPNAQQEERLLVEIMLPSMEELMMIGLAAGVANYSIPVDTPSLTTVLMEQARKDTVTLAKGLTDTTRDLLQRTIQSSLAKRHDLKTLTQRIQDVINNPVRAEMIAQTETVNAYQSGYERYAIETGATSKEWEAKVGACRLCAPLDGKTLPIAELFTLANGRQVSRPAAHVRCRCGLIYNYN